jgi:hypothetical protein
MVAGDKIAVDFHHMDEDQWELLTFTIQEQNCVLVLGPYLYTVLDQQHKEVPIRVLLANELAKKLEGKNEVIPDPNDLPAVSTAVEKKLGEIMLRFSSLKFYRSLKQLPGILEEIVRLPFKLIINTTPDDLLTRAFLKHNGSEPGFGYYDFRGNQTPIDFDRKSDTPFIFNLFGSVEEKDSLVLTHGDHLKLLESILQQETALPNSISRELDQNKTYLFLGFDFESWYLRLLLHTMQQGFQDNDNVFIFGFHERRVRSLKADTSFFFNRQCQVKFLDKEPVAFLRELKQRLQGEATTDQGTEERKLLLLYDKEDDKYRNLLERHLSELNYKPSVRYVIRDIHQTSLNQDKTAARREMIEESQIVVPLLSADFFYDRELFELTAQALRGQKVVIPVLIGPCNFEQTEVGQLGTLLPRNKRPVKRWENKDEACHQIREALEKIVDNQL